MIFRQYIMILRSVLVFVDSRALEIMRRRSSPNVYEELMQSLNQSVSLVESITE
jgi:hypothetical protein